MKILNGHTREENAYIVNDYPYGFTLRTKIRYWIESNKNGDRFCSQTLNPKTNFWNKPKKSTYCSIEILFLNEDNHVKSKAINAGWDNEEKLKEFLEFVGSDFIFNNFQQKQIIRIKAISRTQKYIHSFENQQKENKNNIQKLFMAEYILASKE
jgi:hypothetical protein